MALILAAPWAVGESLAGWLKEELDYELRRKSQISQDTREMLLAEVTEHAEGFRLSQFDPCHLDGMMPMLRQGIHRLQNVPEAMEYNRVQFRRALIEAIHSPVYTIESADEVAAQIAQLSAAARVSIEAQYPDLAEPALMDDLELTWNEALLDLAHRCTSRALKAPLPAEDFEPLVARVQKEPIADFSARSIRNQLARDSSHPAIQFQRSMGMGYILSETGTSGSSAWADPNREYHPSPLHSAFAMAGFGILQDAQREWLQHLGPVAADVTAALNTAYERAGVDDAALQEANRAFTDAMSARHADLARGAQSRLRSPTIHEGLNPMDNTRTRESMDMLLAPAILVQELLRRQDGEEVPAWPVP